MNLYRILTLIILLGLLVHTSEAEKISGKVIDRSGDPIVDASITLQSTGQTEISSHDGTFEFEISPVRRSIDRIKSHIRIHNGKLFLHITDMQDVLVDLFNLNGRKICELQNGKLNPGFYQFPIPEMIGNQILLLRSRIGSVNQVYKLIGNSNVSLLNERSRSSYKPITANVPVSDTLIVTHSKYDDVTVAINSYQQPLTVQMLHYKLSFEMLNTLKFGDTLFNSSNRLMVSFDSLIDLRCDCNNVCDRPDIINVYLKFHVDTTSHPLLFRVPINSDTIIAGFDLVITKTNPACRSVDGVNQDYSINFGIAKADSFPKIVFLNYSRHERYQFDHDSCINVPCLPLVTFDFSEDKILSGAIPEINDSTKLLVGNGQHVNFNGTDVGAQNFLGTIESLPTSDDADFSVDSMSSDGTLWIKWESQSFTLRPGAQKTMTQERIDSSGPCNISISTTDTLINHGTLYPWQIQRNN